MNRTPGTGSISSRSIAITRPDGPTRFGGDLRPAPGRGAQVDHRHAGAEQPVALVDLGELVGRARAVALALRALHVRIVHVPAQPLLARMGSLHAGSRASPDTRGFVLILPRCPFPLDQAAQRAARRGPRARSRRHHRRQGPHRRGARRDRPLAQRPRADQGARGRPTTATRARRLDGIDLRAARGASRCRRSERCSWSTARIPAEARQARRPRRRPLRRTSRPRSRTPSPRPASAPRRRRRTYFPMRALAIGEE